MRARFLETASINSATPSPPSISSSPSPSSSKIGLGSMRSQRTVERSLFQTSPILSLRGSKWSLSPRSVGCLPAMMRISRAMVAGSYWDTLTAFFLEIVSTSGCANCGPCIRPVCPPVGVSTEGASRFTGIGALERLIVAGPGGAAPLLCIRPPSLLGEWLSISKRRGVAGGEGESAITTMSLGGVGTAATGGGRGGGGGCAAGPSRLVGRSRFGWPVGVTTAVGFPWNLPLPRTAPRVFPGRMEPPVWSACVTGECPGSVP